MWLLLVCVGLFILFGILLNLSDKADNEVVKWTLNIFAACTFVSMLFIGTFSYVKNANEGFYNLWMMINATIWGFICGQCYTSIYAQIITAAFLLLLLVAWIWTGISFLINRTSK